MDATSRPSAPARRTTPSLYAATTSSESPRRRPQVLRPSSLRTRAIVPTNDPSPVTTEYDLPRARPRTTSKSSPLRTRPRLAQPTVRSSQSRSGLQSAKMRRVIVSSSDSSSRDPTPDSPRHQACFNEHGSAASQIGASSEHGTECRTALAPPFRCGARFRGCCRLFWCPLGCRSRIRR
jgi:hypothetical protein